MNWEVSKVRVISSKSALKAEVSVKTSWGFINGFRVMKKNDGDIWVNPPQVTYKTPEGETKYSGIIKFNDSGKGKEMWDDISSRIIKAYKSEINKGSSNGDDGKPSKKTNYDKVSPKKNLEDDLDDLDLDDDEIDFGSSKKESKKPKKNNFDEEDYFGDDGDDY